VAFLVGALIASAGTATAAGLITGKQIKDGSIAQRDLVSALQNKIASAKAYTKSQSDVRFAKVLTQQIEVVANVVAPAQTTDIVLTTLTCPRFWTLPARGAFRAPDGEVWTADIETTLDGSGYELRLPANVQDVELNATLIVGLTCVGVSRKGVPAPALQQD
jgi:hypothetical protein